MDPSPPPPPSPVRGALLAAAALLLAACGEGAGDGSAGGPPADPLALVAEPAGGRGVGPGEAIELPFNRPLDPAAVTGGVRVHDAARGGQAIPVEAVGSGDRLLVRPRGGAGWRPGAVLEVRIAGLPSLSALRSAAGDPLPAEARATVRVRSARRSDRTGPVLAGSLPADGAAGVDPASPVVLRFSEPMDSRCATPARGAVALLVDGEPVPFAAWFDRERRELSLLPKETLPGGSAVEVRLGSRARDAAGNALAAASSRRVGWTTAAAAVPGAGGRIVETFEDRAHLDPLGTTVRWNDPAEPGVLSGVREPHRLSSGGGGDSALLLDSRGGTLRILVPVAELGDEVRVLKGLLLAAAPGTTPGEILEPRVRVAAVPAGATLEEAAAEGTPWREATGALRGSVSRGADGGLPLPFRHPVPVDGASALVVEIAWKATAGSVVLRAARHPDVRCTVAAEGFDPVASRTAPTLLLEVIGERAVARSTWMEAPGKDPLWQEPRLRPEPPSGRLVLELQGAPARADGGGPDAARATAWSADPAPAAGLPWIRFRVVFAPGEGDESAAAVDEIVLPFAGR